MTKIIEITNCRECPFCNHKLRECYLFGVKSLNDINTHICCPLLNEEITVKLKIKPKPTLADLDQKDKTGT